MMDGVTSNEKVDLLLYAAYDIIHTYTVHTHALPIAFKPTAAKASLTAPPPHTICILTVGRDRRDASRISKRRLPWHLPHHDKPTILPAYQLHHQRRRRTPFDGDSSSTTSLGGYGAGSLMESLSNSSLRKKGSSGSSYCGRNETGSCDVSLSTTTSKKTMESLSASVYDELEPFRLAHRNVIKVRIYIYRERERCLRQTCVQLRLAIARAPFTLPVAPEVEW